jgi:sec-independent protein translocase protein TatA
VIGDILQPTHLLFVLVIALLVLGPKRLPEVGRALGNGLRDFKSAINGDEDHRDEITDAPGFEYHADAPADEVDDVAVAVVDHDPAVNQAPSGPSPVAPAPAPASDAIAQPLNGVVSEPAAEPTERLG